MKTQEPKITLTQLLNKGYTISQAAREIGYSSWHINRVLRGKHSNSTAIQKLTSLPNRQLVLRRASDK